MIRIKYVAVDDKGVGRTGGTWVSGLDESASWVLNKYRAGWRSLTVSRDGEEIGGIGRDPADERRRIWWAETPIGTAGRKEPS